MVPLISLLGLIYSALGLIMPVMMGTWSCLIFMEDTGAVTSVPGEVF